MANPKLAAVLIPVVVGSLLGLIASVATSHYAFRVERNETLRRERSEHLERAMMLAAKYSNDLSKLLGMGFVAKGDATSNDLAILTAPTDTLQELRVVVLLYFPQLRTDVDDIYAAHRTMMLRFDDIAGDRAGEDAATFNERIQGELSLTVDGVRNLMNKLSDLAQIHDP